MAKIPPRKKLKTKVKKAKPKVSIGARIEQALREFIESGELVRILEKCNRNPPTIPVKSLPPKPEEKPKGEWELVVKDDEEIDALVDAWGCGALCGEDRVIPVKGAPAFWGMVQMAAPNYERAIGDRAAVRRWANLVLACVHEFDHDGPLKATADFDDDDGSLALELFRDDVCVFSLVFWPDRDVTVQWKQDSLPTPVQRLMIPFQPRG